MEVEHRLPLEVLKRLERAEKDAGPAKRLRTVTLAMER